MRLSRFAFLAGIGAAAVAPCALPAGSLGHTTIARESEPMRAIVEVVTRRYGDTYRFQMAPEKVWDFISTQSLQWGDADVAVLMPAATKYILGSVTVGETALG